MRVLGTILTLVLVTLLGTVPAVAVPPDGTMAIGVHVTLVSRWLDPGETEALITPFMVLYALHDALVKPMPGGIMTPSLAESWTASKDGLSYEFVIRKNARFHNGDPVTAEDVKFTFERYKGSGAKLLKEKVKEIQILAPNRVRFVLKEPWPDFMAFYGTSATGAGWIVPKKYIEKVGEDGFKRAPVGRGPLQVRRLHAGHRADARGLRGLLAEGSAGQAPGHALHPRRDHPCRRGEDRRGRRGLSLRRCRRGGPEALARNPGGGPPALRHLLAGLPGPVGPEVALARPAGAPGRQPRHRPAGHQPGRDAGPRQAGRRLRASGVRLRPARRSARLRSEAGQAAHGRGRVPERLRRGRPHPAAAVHLARRRRSAATCRRSASAARSARWSAPPSSPAGGRRSSTA